MLASPKGGQQPLDPKSEEADAQTKTTHHFKQGRSWRRRPIRVRFKVMWRPEEIKVLPQTRRCALNPARRLGYVHAVLG